MQIPILLLVLGTRSEAFAAASLIAQMRRVANQLPFLFRVATTGQEDTELHQALITLNLQPDVQTHPKNTLRGADNRLADARLDAAMLDLTENLLRHHCPAAVIGVRNGATAWATAISAYYKKTPFIHLGAGSAAETSPLPFPEGLHAGDIERLTTVHLCPDEACALKLKQSPQKNIADPIFHTVGDCADELLAQTLEAPGFDSSPTDTTLAVFKQPLPQTIAFLSRREHHADALRPFCRALDTLSQTRQDRNFIVIHSLQSYICDALVSLVPRRDNLHDVSPLPYPAFIRELSRSHLVLTDSSRVAREALHLRRPLILIGSYSDSHSLRALAQANGLQYKVVPMHQEALESTLAGELAQPSPAPAPRNLEVLPSGKMAFDAILNWWKAGGWKT